MKIGFRKPSIKKSIKARTTGKVKRAIKKAVIPTYGKKGTGIIKNPKKAIYNSIYNKTTIDTAEMARSLVETPKPSTAKSSPSLKRASSSGAMATPRSPKQGSNAAASKKTNRFSFSIGKDGNVTPQAIGQYNAIFKYMPPKKGSAAKPRIGCYRHGAVVFDIGAKTTAYKRLAKLIGKQCYLHVTRHRSQIDDGYYSKVEVFVV